MFVSLSEIVLTNFGASHKLEQFLAITTSSSFRGPAPEKKHVTQDVAIAESYEVNVKHIGKNKVFSAAPADRPLLILGTQ